MEDVAMYGLLRDASIFGKNDKIMDLTGDFEEKDILKAMDGYFQELVREYRERNGKERNEKVERLSSAVLLSLMGYEVEMIGKVDDVLDDVEDALKNLIQWEEIRTIIAESNEGVVENLYRKKIEMRRMGE